MTSVRPSYESLQQKVEELECVFDALRSGEVDTVISKSDPRHLIAVRDYELIRFRDRQLAELRVIVELVPTPMAIVWKDGGVYLANQAFLGVSSPDTIVTLQQWAAGLQEGDPFAKQLNRCLDKSLHTPVHPILWEKAFKTHWGNKVHWSFWFHALPEKIRGKRTVIIAARDLTDQKQLIAQLQDSKMQMEEFLTAAAHDLRSPLITISHSITFAGMELGDAIPPKTAECLDRAKSSAKDMLELLHQLSQVSRAGRDTQPRNKQSFHELVQAAIRQLEGTLTERHGEVIVGDDMPDLYCQGTKLVEVFSNLIDNAVKYTPAERTPRIEIGYQQHGPEHLFSVKDNGMGIPQECQKKVFGLFERLSDSSDAAGQGVGLTIAKRIIESHGGRVWVESVLGEGSTFYFTVGKQRKDDFERD